MLASANNSKQWVSLFSNVMIKLIVLQTTGVLSRNGEVSSNLGSLPSKRKSLFFSPNQKCQTHVRTTGYIKISLTAVNQNCSVLIKHGRFGDVYSIDYYDSRTSFLCILGNLNLQIIIFVPNLKLWNKVKTASRPSWCLRWWHWEIGGLLIQV